MVREHVKQIQPECIRIRAMSGDRSTGEEYMLYHAPSTFYIRYMILLRNEQVPNARFLNTGAMQMETQEVSEPRCREIRG